MRKVFEKGRSNILGNNAMVPTSQPLSSQDAIWGGQGIMINRSEGVLIGGSDSRKDGLAIGY